MTPVGFVLLTLMFGVIIPSPTLGKIKMTFGEAMSMSFGELEKRQGGGLKLGEQEAINAFLGCLNKLGLRTGESCDRNFIDRFEDMIKTGLEDIPYDAWVRFASVKCRINLRCSETTCRPNGATDNGLDRDPGAKCDKEYETARQFFPPLDTDTTTTTTIATTFNPEDTTVDPDTGLSRGVRVSIYGSCTTVMVAVAISCRHFFSA